MDIVLDMEVPLFCAGAATRCGWVCVNAVRASRAGLPSVIGEEGESVGGTHLPPSLPSIHRTTTRKLVQRVYHTMSDLEQLITFGFEEKRAKR